MGWNDNNEWTKAVLASDMTAAEKLVLIALSTFADYKTGRNARPKRADLAASLNVSEKTVQRGLDHGLKIGLVTIQTPPHRGKYVTVYAIVPPKHEDTGVPISDQDEDTGVPISDRDEDTGVPHMRTQVSSDMRTQESSVPLHLPSQDLITLSPEQALVRDLLGLDEERDKELLKNVHPLINNQPRTIKRPPAWLRGWKKDELRAELEAQSISTEPADDGFMDNPFPPPEGWGIPKKRVPVEEGYRALMRTSLKMSDHLIDQYVTAASEVHDNGTPRQIWTEAWTTAKHDAATGLLAELKDTA